MKNCEYQPKYLHFSKEIFSGLIFCAAYIQTFEFSNVKTEKTISQQVCRRDSSLSYLSKDKKDIKSLH